MLTPILAIALAFRLCDLDAVTLWGDEPHDVHYSLAHAEYPNPFSTPENFYLIDPSQARLPFYLTGLTVRLLSGEGADAFLTRAGRVEGSGMLGWATTAVAIGLACLVLVVAAPAPIGRWAGLLPLGCVLLMAMILGLPRFPLDQLVAARIAAAIVGAGGVLATYALGREIFDHWAGLLAAGALAFCPTHIGWSRCAVTTGDTFVTTFFVLALWLLYRSLRRGSGRSMMACALAFGLALGAKFSAVLIGPICVLYVVVLWIGRIPAGCEPEAAHPRPRLRWATFLHVGLLFPLALVFLWPLAFDPNRTGLRLLLWLCVLLTYGVAFAWLVRSPWSFRRRHLAWVVLNICAGGLVVAAFATPYHMRAEAIPGVLAWLRSDAAPTTDLRKNLIELSQLIGLPFVQAKIPLGVLALGGMVAALRRKNRHWGSLMIITAVIYVAAVTAMHHKFLYYLLPMLALVHVLGGGAAIGLLRKTAALSRFVAGAMGVVLSAMLILQFYRTAEIHPHYLLDDEPWERALCRRPEVRSVNMQLQGVRPAVRWLVEHAPPGSRVASLYPGTMSRFPLFSRWVTTVLSYESQKLPQDQAGQVVFSAPLEPQPLEQWDYVVFFPLSWGRKPDLPRFEEVFEANLNGEPGAWVFRRRQ